MLAPPAAAKYLAPLPNSGPMFATQCSKTSSTGHLAKVEEHVQTGNAKARALERKSPVGYTAIRR